MINSNIIKNIFLSTGANTYSKINDLVIHILRISVLILIWGPEKFGEWITLYSFLTLLTFADLGFYQVSLIKMNLKYGENKIDEINTTFQSSQILCIFLIFSFSLIYILLGYLNIQYNYLFFKNISNFEFLKIICLICLIFFFNFQTSFLSGVFTCLGKTYVNIFFYSIPLLIDTILIIFLALIEFNFVNIFFGILIFRIIVFLYCYYYFKKNIDFIKLGLNYFSILEIKENLKKSLSYVLFSISNSSLNQVLNILIFKYLGATTLTLFSTIATMCRIVLQFSLITDTSIKVEISKLLGAKDKIKSFRFFILNIQITIIIATFLSIIVLIFGQKIIDIWTSHKISAPFVIIVLISLSAFLRSLYVSSNTLLISRNYITSLSKKYFVNCIIAFLIAIIFIDDYQLISICVALIIFEVLNIYSVVNLTEKNFGINKKHIFSNLFQSRSFNKIIKPNSNKIDAIKNNFLKKWNFTQRILINMLDEIVPNINNDKKILICGLGNKDEFYFFENFNKNVYVLDIKDIDDENIYKPKFSKPENYICLDLTSDKKNKKFEKFDVIFIGNVIEFTDEKSLNYLFKNLKNLSDENTEIVVAIDKDSHLKKFIKKNNNEWKNIFENNKFKILYQRQYGALINLYYNNFFKIFFLLTNKLISSISFWTFLDRFLSNHNKLKMFDLKKIGYLYRLKSIID
tara:strand:- start:662 stop:2725 length:2064 start_codon:yes stop_codon:yes gene_type:complete